VGVVGLVGRGGGSGGHLLAGYDIGGVAAAESVLVASGSEVRWRRRDGGESEYWEREYGK